jgi:hypothetical protein
VFHSLKFQRFIVVGEVAMSLVLPCLFAVDGVVLINQSTVLAAGGFPYAISQPGSGSPCSMSGGSRKGIARA